MLLKKFICIIIFFSAVLHSLYAQNFTGFASGNYSGALGAEPQPASIADNIYPYDVYLAGASAFASNNQYFFFRNNPFLNFNLDLNEDSLAINNKRKYGYFNAKILLPSFMVTLPNDDAIAFSANIRTVVNGKVSPQLAKNLTEEFDNELTFGIPQNKQKAQAIGMSWQEYALTYAKVIWKDRKYLIKAGATGKILIGNGAFYADLENFSYTITGRKNVAINSINLNYGYSDNFEGINNDWKWQAASKPAAGLDMGVVYEYKPDVENKTNCPEFDVARNSKREKHNQLNYKYRVGLAILDAGRIKYDYGKGSGTTSVINQVGNIDILDKLSVESPDQLLDSINTFAAASPHHGQFTIGLPTRLRINIDYHLRKNFYVDAGSELNLSFLKFSDFNVHTISNLVITPRWEIDWAGAYMPVYVNTRGQVNVGFGARIGPLVLGVNDVLSNLTRKELRSQGIYIAFKTFLFRKKNNKDLIICEGVHDHWMPDKKRSKKK